MVQPQHRRDDESDHVAIREPAVNVAKVDYLNYVHTVPRIFAAAIASSLSLATLRVVADFRTSAADGYDTLVGVGYTYVVVVVLCLLFLVGIWIPAVIRTGVLRRRFPHADFYVAKRITGFWSRLELVTNVSSSVLQNATLTVDGSAATLWRGIARPRQIAELPLTHLLRIESDRTGVTPFRRRLLVLTFNIEGQQSELPLALRTLGWFGYRRLTAESQQRLISTLSIQSTNGPQSMSARTDNRPGPLA